MQLLQARDRASLIQGRMQAPHVRPKCRRTPRGCGRSKLDVADGGPTLMPPSRMPGVIHDHGTGLPPELAGWARTPRVWPDIPSELAGWALIPRVRKDIPSEVTGWARIPRLRTDIPSEVTGWARIPRVRTDIPSEVTGWARIPRPLTVAPFLRFPSCASPASRVSTTSTALRKVHGHLRLIRRVRRVLVLTGWPRSGQAGTIIPDDRRCWPPPSPPHPSRNVPSSRSRIPTRARSCSSSGENRARARSPMPGPSSNRAIAAGSGATSSSRDRMGCSW